MKRNCFNRLWPIRKLHMKSALILVLSLFFSFVYPNWTMVTAQGETTMPKFVMMRLEDIGPGGQYDSLDSLGKLRAVLDYMHEQGIAVHLAVIPRWINIDASGNRYDRSLDNKDDTLSAAFAKLLRDAAARGDSIGMHGYTHQVGDARRPDGFQESGIGNEFNVEGLEKTDGTGFAEERMQEGLQIMKAAGITPRFWEAPHYHTTAVQDEIFRRYFGLLYQADVQANRNAHEAQIRNERIAGNGLGAVNVPTPFSYIPYNKDENLILDKLGRSKNIASFFYHPFLEFKHLQAVTDSEGMHKLRDGIPEYKYPDRARTLLQKLTVKLKERGYLFYSIHDYVPFTPAASMPLGAPGDGLVKVADADGDGAADLIRWDKNSGAVTVAADPFRRQRSEAPSEAKVWGTIPYAAGSTMAMCDGNNDRKSDLWVVTPDTGADGKGKLERFDSTGSSFVFGKSWSLGTSLAGAHELFVLPQKNGATVIAALSADQMSLRGFYIRGNSAKAMKEYRFKTNNEKHFTVSRDAAGLTKPDAPALVLARKDASTMIAFTPDPVVLAWKVQKKDLDMPLERGHFTLGDFNGDGREDVLHYDTESRMFGVYLQAPDNSYKLLSTFGPWGGVDAKVVPADLDGNGKCDIALIEQTEPFVDAALSYETQKSPVFPNGSSLTSE